MSSYRLGGLLGIVAFALAAAGNMRQQPQVRREKPKDWDNIDEKDDEKNRRHLQRRNERRNKRQQGH
jgi:hypothetical protein